MGNPAVSVEAIEGIFTHRPPTSEQAERYACVREWGQQSALAFFAMCPASHERDVAIDKLREAVMWANASIAVNERPAASSAVPARTPSPSSPGRTPG